MLNFSEKKSIKNYTFFYTSNTILKDQTITEEAILPRSSYEEKN